MNNQRIDIDRHRWMAVRDGLFVYVRTYRRWSMDIVVAPVERVSVLRRSALPAIRSIPLVSYAALFGAPVFAVCALVMLVTRRDTPLQSLGWALILSIVLTAVFAGAMLLFGRIAGRRETMLYMSGNVYSPMIRFKHVEGTNAPLEAFLDALPAGYALGSDKVPLGEWFRLPAPLRSTLGTLYWPFYIVLLWPRDSFEGELLDSIIRGCLLIFLGAYLVFLSLQCFFYFRNPKATKEARAALLDGDYDAAAVILNGALEKTPDQPYANFLLLAESLVRGDLVKAASCADAVERSGIRQYVQPPVFGITVHRPVAEKLRTLDQYLKDNRSGNDSIGAAESVAATNPVT
jgi:hypothetical protein